MVRIGGEETSSDSEAEAPPERRAPSGRSGRGNRMQNLIADEEDEKEDDADKEFYQQGFWADEDADDDFDGDADDEEGRDSFDSDFGNSTSSEDDEDEEENEKRKKPIAKKKSVYRDPKLAHKKGEGPAPGEAGSSAAAAAPKPKKRPRPDPVASAGFAAPLERSRRGATEAATAAAVEKRKSMDAAAKARAEKLAASGGRVVELRRLTQEEILAEAVQTEIMNKASLERMLRLEEEKRRVVKTTRVLDGPRIRFVSRVNDRGAGSERKLIQTVSFIETPVPSNIDGIAPPYPVAPRCAVTGQPAKYIDPQTGTPYATLEAFRMLRGRTGRRHNSFGGGPAPLPGEE